MRNLRIGLIGASRVATYAVIDPARTLPDVEVAAVAARDGARARAYAAEHGIERVLSYEALYADPDIDLVYIGTPPSAHREQALSALAAGKPVLIEKPVAMNATEARDICDAARAAGVQAFEAMHSLHHALFAHLRLLLAQDTIGEVVSVDARFDAAVGTPPGEFRWDSGLGGGALMDLGVYPLAWCRFLVGEAFEVDEATARRDGTVDVGFTATLRFANGVVARVASAMDAPRHEAALTIIGTRGRIDVINPIAPQRGNSVTVETAAGKRTTSIEGPATYLAQLMAVRDALTGAAPFPRAADDYVRSMEAIDKVRATMPR